MPTDKNAAKEVQEKPAAHKDTSAKSAATSAARLHAQLEMLFADLERLACDPASATREIRLELEALRGRLLDLEKQVLESREVTPPSSADGKELPKPVTQEAPIALQAPPAAPLLYENEQIGFAYSEDKLQPVRDSSILSNAPAAITAPLTSSGQPIGEVQLASPSERSWTPEETDVVNAVAQQVSLQIQSLRLLAETERARMEAESATRRFMHEGWASYLDAIHQNERIGYAYDQSAVTPFTMKSQLELGFQESVKVMEEQVGTLYLEPDPAHPLSERDREMVSAVASQIAQQVENIRLLADASRARLEADEVIKRMTRESWESFTEEKEQSSLGFAYDSNQVTPRSDNKLEQAALSVPLQVRGETIGHLAVSGMPSISSEASELATAIAAQTSTHLETLRLNDELRQRAAELQELDRLKSAFLANMSHELRTPLNSILGFSDVILEEMDGPLTETMNNDLKLIQKNGQHLLHLINDVLDMAKIEAGRMNLSPEKFALHEVLDEVISITSPMANEKNLAFLFEKDSDQAVQIFADRTRMRQIMINLVNNAIKYTEKGRISIRTKLQESQQVLITVKDTGIGIAPDKLETIFQEFAQIDSSSTRKGGGTGLGLPISRRLVEMHGGRLWAESNGIPGEGSTFFVELPLEARITEPIELTEKQPVIPAAAGISPAQTEFTQ
jgi:signal transduction histidine kinase